MEEEKKYKRMAKWTLVIVALLTVFMGVQVSEIGFDYNFERFFPQNDPETDFFLAHRDKYGSENDFIMISIENDKGIFDKEFLAEAKRFQDTLVTLIHVESAQSLLNTEEPIKEPLFGAFYTRPYLRWDEPEHYGIDSARVMSSPNLVNSLVTEDARAMAIVLDHTQMLSKEKCDEISAAVNGALPYFNFDNLYISGRSVGQGYFVERLRFELALFMSASILLIIIFLIIAFRSAWGVIVPLLVVLMSIVWLIGLMHLFGKAIDLLLTILPTILFVVGMSDVVHILSKYFDELRKGSPKMEAIKTSVKEVGLATFLTSLTTSIGFLTLMGSSIVPIREFGILSAVGVLLAYLLAFTILPATMILTRPPNLRNEKRSQDFWSRHLHSFYLWIIKNRQKIAWSSLALIVICLIGMSRIQVNNYLLEDLRKDNPFRVQFDYFEDAYSGVRPFELAFMVTDSTKSILDPDVLRDLDRLDSYLRSTYEAGFIMSPLNIIKELNKASHSGKSEYYKLPIGDREIRKLCKNLERTKNLAVVKQLLAKDLKECRLAGKMGDWGKIEIDKRNDALADFWRKEMPVHLDYRVTGTAALIDLNNQYLSTTMVWGLFVAFLIVALIVGLMYRSLKMVLIALIPNMLPLMMIAAIMGFTGINLKVSTSIIFTIAFGIAVDDTIHFVSRMRLELAKGRSRQYALKRSFISTGKAIIITSLILIGGFLTLILSTFKGTLYTGSLLSLTLLFAVLVDLLLLPVLFWMFYPKEKVRS